MKNVRVFFISLLVGAASAIAGTATFEAATFGPTPAEETSRDLFSLRNDLHLPERFQGVQTRAR